MLNTQGGYRAVIFGFIALCIVASTLGAKAGEGANGPGIRIASVDREELFSKYKFWIDQDNQIATKQKNTESTIQVWAQNALLTAQDETRLSDLTLEQKAAGVNFDANKKNELDKLKKQSDDYAADFTNLQSNQNPTPQQQMRLGVLTRAYSDTNARIDALKKTVTAELQKQAQEAQVKTVQAMRESIAQVAKQKGINLVLGTETAYFSDSDITETVLANMNSKIK